MKAVLVIAGVALLGWFGWLLARSGRGSPATATRAHEPPTTVTHDAAEVFRRAFWKHPTAADRIRHAERRVWSADGQVEKWQWFLVLEPSPELVQYLRVDNAFLLTAAPSLAQISDPPSWFSLPSKDADILRSPDGSMQFVFERQRKLLYATATGRGFAGAAASPHPPQGNNGNYARRLPGAPPPDPR